MVVETKTAAGGASQRRPRHQQIDAVPAVVPAVAVVDEPALHVDQADASPLSLPLPNSGEAPPGGGLEHPTLLRLLPARLSGGSQPSQDLMAGEAASVVTAPLAALPEATAPNVCDLVAGRGGGGEVRERRRKRSTEARMRSTSGGPTADRGGGGRSRAGRSAERGAGAGAITKASGSSVDVASAEAGGSSKAAKALARGRVHKSTTPRAATVASVLRPPPPRGEEDGELVLQPVDAVMASVVAPSAATTVPADSSMTVKECPSPDAVGGVDVGCGEVLPAAPLVALPPPIPLNSSPPHVVAQSLEVAMALADPPWPVAVAEEAPPSHATGETMGRPAGLLFPPGDPLAVVPPDGAGPTEALDSCALRRTSDEADAAAGITVMPGNDSSAGSVRGGGGGIQQSQDATTPAADPGSALLPAAVVDAKEVVRPVKSHKGVRLRTTRAKTSRSSRAHKEGAGAAKNPRSARAHDAATAMTGLIPRTSSRNKSQTVEVPGAQPESVAGAAALPAATVALREPLCSASEGPGGTAETNGPAVEAVETGPPVTKLTQAAGADKAQVAVVVVATTAADTAGDTPGTRLLSASDAAAASATDAVTPLPGGPPVPISRKARHSGVSSHLSSASSTSRQVGGTGGGSGTFSDSMLSNGSANGSLRLALALSRASSSTSSFASPTTTDKLAAAAPVADGSLAGDVSGASSRRPPSTVRARNYGASPSLSMGNGRRAAAHTPSSLRDLRKVSGALSGRLLALRREWSMGLQDHRGGGADGSGGDGLIGKAGGNASRRGSFDQGGLLGSGKAAHDQTVTMESSPSLLGAGGAADSSSSGAPPPRRIYGSNSHGGNRFLASSFSGGTASSRRLGALLRAASGAAGSATAGLGGMAGRSSSRVRPSRTGHLGADALPPSGGGGGSGSGSGSGGSGGEVLSLDDLTDAPSRARGTVPGSSTSSNVSLSPAAKAAAISSPSFISNNRSGRRPQGPAQGDRSDGTSKIAALMLTDRGRGAKTCERMFATELTSVDQLVASNVQFRESDMSSGGRRMSARLRRRPVSVPATGLVTAKDADSQGRFGQLPRLMLSPSDKAIEGSASAGELRLVSPVTPST
ncbi:hypothetical protein MMPV_000198 [Pyropia vietnamensis]